MTTNPHFDPLYGPGKAKPASPVLPGFVRDAAQATDDIVRLMANGITFGAADKLEGAGAAERTQAAADRAGLAGDVAGVLGLGGGLKAAWSGLKALPKVAAPVAKAAFTKKGGAAAALGLGTLATYLERQPDQVVKPAKAASAQGEKALSPVEGRPLLPARGMGPQGRFATTLDNIFRDNPELSLNQLGAIAQMLPAPAKARGAKDLAGDQVLQFSEMMAAQQIAAARENPDRAAGAAAETSAYEAHLNRMQALAGGMSFADMMMLQGPPEEEPKG